MSKFWLFIFILLIGGLIYTGILEVNFNFDSDIRTDVPGVANTIVREKATYEKGRAYIVGLKRKSELIVVRNREKRLVLSLVYVKTDAVRLEELIDSDADAAGLLPQAEQLVSSLNLVRTNAQKAPVEVVAQQKQASAEAFALAQQSLGRLQEQHEQYTQIQDEFTRLTGTLEEQIGDLGISEDTEEVAGTRQEASTDSSDEPEGESTEESDNS